MCWSTYIPVLDDPVGSAVGIGWSIAHHHHLMSQLTVVGAAHVVIVKSTAVELGRWREGRAQGNNMGLPIRTVKRLILVESIHVHLSPSVLYIWHTAI